MAVKKKTRIGLDIGSFSVKYAVLSFGKEKTTLSGFGVRRLADTSEEKIKAVLASLASELPDKNVNISISGPSVVVRYINLPKMKAEELASSMQFEAEKYIPFNISEVILDHQILEPDIAGKMKVLLVAAKKKALENRIKILQETGLSINIIDVDSFALINAFCLNNPASDPDKVRALLNIGDKLSSIDVIKNDLPYFTRDFLIGGRAVTKAVSQKLGLDIESAEKLKQNPESRESELMEAAGPVLSSMADEIRLSLSYYENQFGAGVDELYLSGGTVNQKSFVQSFNDNLDLNCRLWDPTGVFGLGADISREKLDKVKNELPVAIGLALRE